MSRSTVAEAEATDPCFAAFETKLLRQGSIWIVNLPGTLIARSLPKTAATVA